MSTVVAFLITPWLAMAALRRSAQACNLDEGLWADRLPDKRLLSERVPQHPVHASGLHGFATWNNELSLERAAILLVTDAYSDGWRAVALPGSSQSSYELLPANAVLRAVPLERGRHRLRIEYAPPASTIGHWVSATTGMVWLGAVGFAIARGRATGPRDTQPESETRT